ncbi:EF-hand domain-containing protein [Acidovorax sp. NCPPB 3859]|nr:MULTISPECIES: EF-hand domain-containing protein [unclassified Acidovorax]MDA8448274.1 EF-hand domain-containing protein [Acidovorax sp. GBBC 3297]MDA8457759.1 EF-hand domain-containing protein [Acidovorax sp. GBBC 3333]MDA8462717.1 EF-hand domain-containing protein [Acidovorax sp. GBBC 3332]MDA8467829.1 EF-hand domain-containing protein [Acidovorax sp. GBBC 3299]WCM77848.1 EF-hand domain-containing protein [Acidovorax sp. GBBC 712]
MMRLRNRLHHPLAALALGVAATLATAPASAADAPSKATAKAPHASAAAAEPAQSTASQPLSKGEIKAIREFHMLDFNGDGKLSRKEVAIIPRLAAAFDDADTNHDGYVTLDEVRAYTVKYRAERDRAKAAAAAASAASATGSPAPAASAPAARK